MAYLFAFKGNLQLTTIESDLSFPNIAGFHPTKAKPLWLELLISNIVKLIGCLGDYLVFFARNHSVEPKRF